MSVASTFDADTRLERGAPGRYQGRVTDRWNVGTIPNGGYLLSLLAVGAEAEAAHPDLLVVSAHFLGRGVPDDDATVEATRVKAGRTTSVVEARLVQQERERVRALATFGDLGVEGYEWASEEPPLAPHPPLDAFTGSNPAFSISEQLDIRYPPGWVPAALGGTLRDPDIHAWLRFADGRPTDARSLLLFADAMIPPVLNLGFGSWVPTLELTVQIRHRPAPGWLRGRFRTRFITAGYLEEDVELWDETGRLVCLARQLAKLLQPAPTSG